MDLEGFTVMSKSLRILIGSLIEKLKQVLTTVRLSTNFHRSGNSFARLLIMTEKKEGA